MFIKACLLALNPAYHVFISHLLHEPRNIVESHDFAWTALRKLLFNGKSKHKYAVDKLISQNTSCFINVLLVSLDGINMILVTLAN